MKLVQQSMDYRREHDAHYADEDETAKQCVAGREESSRRLS